MFYLHWIDVGTTEGEWATASTWDASYAVSDEQVIFARIDHQEGQIPALTVQVKNPQIGLLNPNRKIWAWFSWDGNGYPEPLFFGRLVGIPTDLLGEAVTLQFTARSKNFVLDKQIAAEALKVRPYWDPVFIDVTKRDDPDAILEGYSALWHIDRVSLKVSPSDVLIGEDGTAVFTASDVPYDSVQFSLSQIPLTAVAMNADVSWSQEFTGYIDTGSGVVRTYSGDGIISEWPRPGSSLGSGWSVSSSYIKDLNYIANVPTISYSRTYQNTSKNPNYRDVMSKSLSASYPIFSSGTELVYAEITREEGIGYMNPYTVDKDGDPSPTNIPSYLSYTMTYVPQWRVKYSLGLRYDSSRARTERIEFIMTADAQPVLTEALLSQETETLTMTGADVGVPIIDFKNWTAVAGKYVDLGDFIFPDNPLVAGQRSIQVCIVAGIAGTTIPTFSNVAGVTTQDGSVVWSSLGYASGIYNITTDWSRYREVPLGEIILPHIPFSILYKDYVMPGRMQDPPVGVAVSQYQIVQVPNKGYYQATIAGTTGTGNPRWDEGYVTDGSVTWQFIGTALPTGVDYYICTHAGTTGAILPRFGDGTTYVNDGNVVWTKLSSTEVPIGGAPGSTPRNDYFPTDRGNWSLEYLMCLARARLRMRSRAVEISFDCKYERVTTLSCRMNATIFDRRFPGGVATGKIISYSMIADGTSGQIYGNVRIGCSVGYDSIVDIIVGDPDYVDEDYVDPEYQVYVSAVNPATDDIGYTPPVSNVADTFTFPLTADKVFLNGGIQVRGSLSAQVDGISSALYTAWYVANFSPQNPDSPEEALEAQRMAQAAAANSIQVQLQKNPIWLELSLLPVAGTRYDNFYSIEVTPLPLPKMIDLEAASGEAPAPPVGSTIVYATASFRGVGNVNYTGAIPLGNAKAGVAGEGLISVHAYVIGVTRAAFGGAGSIGGRVGQRAEAAAAFAGSSNSIVRTRHYLAAEKTFAGVGNFVARARQVVYVENAVSFNGNGVFNASGTQYTPALAFDAFGSLTGQTGASFSYTHTPVRIPKGVLVFVTGTVGTDTVDSVTYGGVPMNEVHVSPNLKAASEAGAVWAYFLGSNIPSGPQTVAVNGTASGSKNVYSYTVTSAAGTNVTVADAKTVNSNSVSNPTATLSVGSRNAFCALAFVSGVDAVGSATPTANWNSRSEIDHGTVVAGTYSYDIVSNTDVAAGWTQGADDAVMVAIALVEGSAEDGRLIAAGEGVMQAFADPEMSRAGFNGSGSAFIEATLLAAAYSVFDGTSTFYSSALTEVAAEAAFSGTGFAEVIDQNKPAEALLAGTGITGADTFVSTAHQGSSALAGSGAVVADAFVSTAHQGSSEFAGSGAVVADGTVETPYQYAEAAFGGSASMATDNGVAARYWRIYIRKNGNNDTYSTIAELEFREAIGGSDVTGSGTASAGSNNGNVAANAFDNDTATYWGSGNLWEDWIQYDFGSGVQKAIIEVAMTARNATPLPTPNIWQLQYSNDGSNWTTKWYVAHEDAFTESQQRVYNSSNTIAPVSAYSYDGIMDPNDILGSDIRAWFAADLLSSGTQRYWPDISGNNKHLGNGTPNYRPTVSAAAQNSKNVLDFDGTDDALVLDAPWQSGDTSGSFYIVIKTDNENDKGFMDLSSDSQNDHYPYLSSIYTGALSTARKTVGNPTPALTDWRIVHIHSASSDWAFWIDGTSIYSTGTNTVYLPTANNGGFSLKIAKSRGNFWVNGLIAEVIFAKGKPSTYVRQQIEGYLAHKWGLTGNLASDHPYKTYPPVEANFSGSGSMTAISDLNARLLEDGTSYRLLEDGTSKRLKE